MDKPWCFADYKKRICKAEHSTELASRLENSKAQTLTRPPGVH